MIKQNVEKIINELPDSVQIVGAVKNRTAEEILEAISGGLYIIGENYVQEAVSVYDKIGSRVKWHFIGHLQKNKVKKVVEIFDMIETVDSLKIAQEIDKRCKNINKTMPVLLEINSGREPQKHGIIPEQTEPLVKEVSKLKNIRVKGLMTMGPMWGDPENARPFFQLTKNIFDKIKSLEIPNIEMKYLSMGMSGTYKTAISEGANIVRIGTKLFGERPS